MLSFCPHADDFLTRRIQCAPCTQWSLMSELSHIISVCQDVFDAMDRYLQHQQFLCSSPLLMGKVWTEKILNGLSFRTLLVTTINAMQEQDFALDPHEDTATRVALSAVQTVKSITNFLTVGHANVAYRDDGIWCRTIGELGMGASSITYHVHGRNIASMVHALNGKPDPFPLSPYVWSATVHQAHLDHGLSIIRDNWMLCILAQSQTRLVAQAVNAVFGKTHFYVNGANKQYLQCVAARVGHALTTKELYSYLCHASFEGMLHLDMKDGTIILEQPTLDPSLDALSPAQKEAIKHVDAFKVTPQGITMRCSYCNDDAPFLISPQRVADLLYARGLLKACPVDTTPVIG